MNTLVTRTITGAVFVAALIFCSYFHWGTFVGLFSIFVVLGSREYLSILSKNSSFSPNKLYGILIPLTLFITSTLGAYGAIHLAFTSLVLPLIALLFIQELFRKKDNPFGNIAHSLIPTLWIGLPFSLFVISNKFVQPILSDEYHAQLALAFYFTLWSNDTGAYLSGRAFGKTKLFERISPNKTWEGTIGGALAALGICYLCSFYYDLLSTEKWLFIGLLIVVFGSVGDLVESLFKRSMGVKDSGTLLPGHGGVLDRFDSLIMAAPFVFTFLILTEIALK